MDLTASNLKINPANYYSFTGSFQEIATHPTKNGSEQVKLVCYTLLTNFPIHSFGNSIKKVVPLFSSLSSTKRFITSPS